ncbi:MAG: glycosyltransferase family 2 protein [Clostridiales bacterium]|nr:glycosyltransferase family 2 protein [Clostridiales bacterium]
MEARQAKKVVDSEVAALVSVIVPIYGAESYLPRCLDSILAQSYGRFELILIEDGSPAGCPRICDAYAAADARVRVFHQPNAGVSAARNAGLNVAAGEYIAFVDADDWVEPEYLNYLLGLLRQVDAPLAACNHFVHADGRDIVKFSAKYKTRRMLKREAFESILYHLPPDVSPWGKLYHRSLFEQLRYPEGRIFEDTFLIADLLEAANRIVYGATPQYHYRFLANTISKGAFSPQKWDYVDAVEHMTSVVLTSFPELKQGCERRQAHAALSVRRLLVGAGANAAGDRARCEAIIRKNARSVLFNRRVPFRDKAAILLLLAGPRVFDAVWSIYGKLRRIY